MTRHHRAMLAILVLLALVLAGCSQMLHSPIEPDADHANYREAYAAHYPDDPYAELIEIHAIRKGMSTRQVLASWGRPIHNFPEEDKQMWIYEFSDDGSPDSQPKTITHLFFERDELVRWKRDRRYVDLMAEPRDVDYSSEFGDLKDPGSSNTQKQ